MNKCIVGIALFMGAVVAWGDVEVVSVTAKQRYPCNGLVDVTVTLSGTKEECMSANCTFVATNKVINSEVQIRNMTPVGTTVGSGDNWMRQFAWNALADVRQAKIVEVVLTVDARVLGGVQLWENGPYWAECNVGATRPEEYGYYFCWGDTVGYKRNAENDGWVSVKDGTRFSFSDANCPTIGKNNSQLKSRGYINSKGNLVAAHDAATAHLGAPWRMPTEAEFSALISNCDTTWTTRGGVYGRLVTGRGAYASRSIFLPAAGYGDGSYLYGTDSLGYYWSSTPDSDYSDDAWRLYFRSGSFCRSNDYRYHGRSVRPLRGFAQ